MKDLDDLSNAQGLDESITEDYTNYYGDDDYSNAKGWFKAAVKNVTSTVKAAGQSVGGAVKAAGQNISSTTKDIGQNIKSTTKDIGQNIKSTTKDIGKNISSTAKDAQKNITENTKKLRDKAKDAAKKMRDKIKETENRIGKKLKKVIKKLKDVVGKFKDKFKNAMRKVMRNLILKSIRGNIHGLATKMFAAIGTADEVKAKKIKSSFVSKSKNAYASILAQWKKLGGSESEFNDAIRTGSSKKMLKNPFNRADGNNHDEFYSYIASEDYYYGVDGDDELAKAEAEKIKADEEAAAVINEDDATLEVPDEEEKISGFKAFIAKIIGFFKRNKGDENPYEEGDPAADDFAAQEKADEGNQPSESASDNTLLDELSKDDDSKEEDSDDDDSKEGSASKEGSPDGDKILGMPKGVAIGVGVAVLAIGGFFAYKYFKGKK